jgi:hypothetical protein
MSTSAAAAAAATAATAATAASILTPQEDAVFRFLFDLQTSGETNMFDAPKYIMRDSRFADLTITEVRALLFRWMSEYDQLRAKLQ